LKHVLSHDEIMALERGAARYECSVAVFHVAVTEWYSLLRARGVVVEKLPLDFDHKPSDLTSAVDVFAMDEPLSASGEGLWSAAMAVVESGRRDPASNRLLDVDL
jgi:hypothetical protein